MRRVSLSGLEKTLPAIWQWYAFQSSLSLAAKSRIRRELLAGEPPSDPAFFGLSLEEVDDFFKELDFLAIFDLLAAAEAALRIDFLNRAYRGKGDSISKQFRGLFKQQHVWVRLEDILDAWKNHRPAAKSAVRDFSSVLTLRHWLAHGRYWTPKFRITCSPADVFDIANDLLAAIA